MNIDAFLILTKLFEDDIQFLKEKDPFRFLIMVILSAQTTDIRVNEVSKVLFEKYPTCLDLSNADVKDVEDIVRSLGFYKAKSKNIIQASKYIVSNGSIPETIEELIKIPGVGRKTANCYLGTILNKGAIIVDTHFKRVATRLSYTEKENEKDIELDIKNKLDEKYWYRFSMVLNAFGRVCCKSQNPNCKECLVSSYCNKI